MVNSLLVPIAVAVARSLPVPFLSGLVQGRGKVEAVETIIALGSSLEEKASYQVSYSRKAPECYSFVLLRVQTCTILAKYSWVGSSSAKEWRWCVPIEFIPCIASCENRLLNSGLLSPVSAVRTSSTKERE